MHVINNAANFVDFFIIFLLTPNVAKVLFNYRISLLIC